MSTRLYRRFLDDVAAADLPLGPGDDSPVTDEDLAGFDEPVQRYLRFMGVVGRPRVWSFESRFAGRFRQRVDGPWMDAEAFQYNTRLDVARIFTMRLLAARVVPMIGHDTYVRGRGHMLGKVFGLITVADGSGEEFDIGELSTYLNDAILLAPSMLLGPDTSWEGTGEHSFEVRLTDRGRQVTAQVSLDEHGAPVDFSTVDRWAALPGGPVRARWRTPVPHWTVVDGRPFPGRAEVTWDLDDGPFTYIQGGFVPGSVRCNVAPPDERTARADGRLPADDWRDVLTGLRGAGIMAAELVMPFRRARRTQWGAPDLPADSPLPGDDLVAEPRWQWTHAIEVEASAAAVWPWVAQIGADRGGFYSYQWLENLVGCKVRNADSVHPDWQVGPGDGVLLHPSMPALPVVAVEEGHWYVAHAGPGPDVDRSRDHWTDASWLFLVEPLGEDRCRVVSRYRCATSDDLATRLQMGSSLVEPIGSTMDVQMLRGIRERAEQRSQSNETGATGGREPAVPSRSD